ncbi:hypothetical protein QF034_005180 [Streptomyces africanus]|uniref:Uncharacterized protein n=1 Tax=Streptomyces africanus TaxID=231024 RepID=A0ABU0QU67_9ACTN|nr:hypothetical protein [Streptomyces africanus]
MPRRPVEGRSLGSRRQRINGLVSVREQLLDGLSDLNRSPDKVPAVPRTPSNPTAKAVE